MSAQQRHARLLRRRLQLSLQPLGSHLPDPLLADYESDYRWLSQVYISVQPTNGAGALLWHSLGAKTIELIYQNVHVPAVRDDLDAELIEALLKTDNPDRKAKELQIKIVDRLPKHMGNPLYRKLSERLKRLKEQHEAGRLHSISFLKALLDLTHDLVNAEKEVSLLKKITAKPP